MLILSIVLAGERRNMTREEWVKENAVAIFNVMRNLKRGMYGGLPCFCEKAIGHPSLKEHSSGCKRARELFKQFEEETC